jgi:ABC-type polysaccharide/polyol phosphate transport system ATPase subunit
MQEVIRIESVGVRFDHHATQHRSLRAALSNIAKNRRTEYFEALKDVSFTADKGETIGLIGRNGAGKSTLLRVIAGVIKPQLGKVIVSPSSRLVPLLELGIRFQPELTGRENCFLAGALMGLSKKQIHAKLDGIIKFAEVGDFMNEPVKTYSSGMYARLAFSLATEIEPDILLLDEILGVGDMFFMRKCTARMQKIIRNGTTTIMVSHNLDFLVAQCSRLAWLEHGQIRLQGEPKMVADAYRNLGDQILNMN